MSNKMEELSEYRRLLLERCRAIGQEVEAALAPLSPSAQHRLPDVQGWSPHRVAAHLRDLEAQAFWPRIQRILQEENPLLENFDRKAWMLAHYNSKESLKDILEDYLRLRQREMELLNGLPQAAWSRTARHPCWGVRTLQWWVEQSLAHAAGHLRQLNTG